VASHCFKWIHKTIDCENLRKKERKGNYLNILHNNSVFVGNANNLMENKVRRIYISAMTNIEDKNGLTSHTWER
jgi:hypothetical protein